MPRQSSENTSWPTAARLLPTMPWLDIRDLIEPSLPPLGDRRRNVRRSPRAADLAVATRCDLAVVSFAPVQQRQGRAVRRRDRRAGTTRATLDPTKQGTAMYTRVLPRCCRCPPGVCREHQDGRRGSTRHGREERRVEVRPEIATDPVGGRVRRPPRPAHRLSPMTRPGSRRGHNRLRGHGNSRCDPWIYGGLGAGEHVLKKQRIPAGRLDQRRRPRQKPDVSECVTDWNIQLELHIAAPSRCMHHRTPGDGSVRHGWQTSSGTARARSSAPDRPGWTAAAPPTRPSSPTASIRVRLADAADRTLNCTCPARTAGSIGSRTNWRPGIVGRGLVLLVRRDDNLRVLEWPAGLGLSQPTVVTASDMNDARGYPSKPRHRAWSQHDCRDAKERREPGDARLRYWIS